ncbi:chaperone modulator CbpM [Woeseia oceani]|uniref:MerR family transcriptional regulator n=1 Tax=Woeseia oceani TaxID=1548547 RepID=A0A193LJP3_9GAMM|nr:chaperone modulator CbpM [Woeseia oceani]ANO52760.1 MerR family transcriptional regulator [Woeseia oceani]
MTNDSRKTVLQSEIIETRVEMTLSDLCRVCTVSSERVVQLVEEGLVEPVGNEPAEWRFSGHSVRRVVVAERLSRDLRLNPAGAALVLDLLDEVQQLRQRLSRLEESD